MSSSEEDEGNGNREEEDGRGLRRPRLSDFFFVMGPQRPARRIFSIEEAFEFANEIGEALRRERRNSNIIIGAFLCVLIFVVVFYTILFILLYKRVLLF